MCHQNERVTKRIKKHLRSRNSSSKGIPQEDDKENARSRDTEKVQKSTLENYDRVL